MRTMLHYFRSYVRKRRKLATLSATAINQDYDHISRRSSATNKKYLSLLRGYIRKGVKTSQLSFPLHTLHVKRRHCQTTTSRTPLHPLQSHILRELLPNHEPSSTDLPHQAAKSSCFLRPKRWSPAMTITTS